MKLITDELKARFAEIGDQSELDNPIVVAKFFDPTGSATWYATDYDPETNICTGYVTGLGFDEWGSFSIDELESLQLPFGLTIERDLYINEMPFSDILQDQSSEKIISTNEIEIKDTEQEKIDVENEVIDDIVYEEETSVLEPDSINEQEVEQEDEFIHNNDIEQDTDLER